MIENKFHNQYKMRVNLRPVKYAYFIREDDWTTLKGAIQLMCTQWGGIRSILLPVKNDMTLEPLFKDLLKIHEPDYFIGYMTRDDAKSYFDDQNKLQAYIANIFPQRQISLQDGRFFADNDHTAHALHVLTEEDLKNKTLNVVSLFPDFSKEHFMLALYGSIYPGQEEYYVSQIKLRHENIELGSREYWLSQTSSDPFLSVLNLTSYQVSAFRAVNYFDHNEYNVVVGSDISTICMYWGLRALREAVRFKQEEFRRQTLLIPTEALEDSNSLRNM